jgi:hypothetical protein
MSLNLDFHNSPLILIKYYTCCIKEIEDITQSSSPAHNSTSSNQHGKYLHEKTRVRSIQNTKEKSENQATQKERQHISVFNTYTILGISLVTAINN